MKVPTTLAQIKRHPAVDIIKKEYDGSKYSYWVYLKAGWINPLMECAIIHESTVQDVCEQFKTIKKK